MVKKTPRTMATATIAINGRLARRDVRLTRTSVFSEDSGLRSENRRASGRMSSGYSLLRSRSCLLGFNTMRSETADAPVGGQHTQWDIMVKHGQLLDNLLFISQPTGNAQEFGLGQ